MISIEDAQLTTMIINEIDKVIIILNPENRVVMANDYAVNKLGIANGDDLQCIERIFGNNLYTMIANQSFNFQWNGTLFANVSGKRLRLDGRAKYVTGNKSVYNNLLLIASIESDEPSNILSHEYLGLNWEQIRRLYEISATINSNLDFQSICRDITMKAAELVGADRSLLYSVGGLQIGVFSTWNMTEEEVSLFRLVDMEHGVIKNCLRNMAPVLVPCYSRHPDWIPEIYEGLGRFESFILFPLLAQKQLVGVLALFKQEPSRFDDRTIMILQMISNQMAIAVLNAQVYSEIHSLNKHLEEEVHLKVNELRISELQLLRKSNEQEAVLNAITDSLVVLDEGYRILDINLAAITDFGFIEKKQALSKKYCDILCKRQYCRGGDKACLKICSAAHCEDCLISETFTSGKQNVAEVNVADRVHMISTYPIFDEEGKIQKVVCLLRDITLLKRRSGELVQSQKMQAIGQLAAGVAHEIRNPLGAISNYVYILEEWIAEIESKGFSVEQEVRHSFFAIKKLVERSETVIRNLLDFSREKPQEIALFSLNEVIDQILMLVGKTAQKKKVEICISGPSDLLLRSNSSALQHILFNLVVNAIDALPEGGKIEMTYQLVGSSFEICVIDNGEGIMREDMEKIYNPFYTTKAPNKGTGLGLYIVYNLIKQLGGRIAVTSQPGIKTQFTVILPQ